MDRKRLAEQIITSLATAVASEIGKEIGRNLGERITQFVSSDPTPPPEYEVVHGGARFQVSRDVFVRQELPRNIDYLLKLPAERVRALLSQAQSNGASSPEQVLMNLVRLVQSERIQQTANRR